MVLNAPEPENRKPQGLGCVTGKVEVGISPYKTIVGDPSLNKIGEIEEEGGFKSDQFSVESQPIELREDHGDNPKIHIWFSGIIHPEARMTHEISDPDYDVVQKGFIRIDEIEERWTRNQKGPAFFYREKQIYNSHMKVVCLSRGVGTLESLKKLLS